MADTNLFFGNQNLPTNAAQVQQLPAGTQYGIDTAMMKRALAQVMLQKGLQSPQGQMIDTGGGAPGHFVRPAATQYMASLAQQLLGANMLGGSQQDLANVMMNYQTQHNATQEAAAKLLGGSSGTPVQPSAAAISPPQGITSADAVSAYSRLKQSGDPASMAEADKLIPLIGELRKNEAQIASTQKVAGLEAGAKAATGPSTIAAVQGGIDTSKLQPPPQLGAGTATPGVVPNAPGGVTLTQQPQTGAVTAQESQEGRLQQQAQGAQQRALLSEQEDLRKQRQDVIDAGYMGSTAQAFKDIIGSGLANTGALAQDVTKLQQYSKLLGHPVPPNTPYSQIAHELALSFIGSAKAASGLQGRMSASEWQQLKDVSGQTLEQQPKALMTYADNAIAYATSRVRGYQSRVRAGAAQSPNAQLDPRTFGSIDIGEGDIPSVSSGLPVGGPAMPPTAPAANPGYRPVQSNRRIFNPDGTPSGQ